MGCCGNGIYAGGASCLDSWSGCNGRGTAAPNGIGNGDKSPPAGHHPEPKMEVVGGAGQSAAQGPQGQKIERQAPARLPAAAVGRPSERRQRIAAVDLTMA
jgi:hypothetical protein